MIRFCNIYDTHIFLVGNEEGSEYLDTKLMPPPSWLPKSIKAEDDPSVISPEKNSSSKFHTPLASLRPPELANVDVTELFPEFRPGQVHLLKMKCLC